MQRTMWIDEVPDIVATAEGLVRIPGTGGFPPVIMPPRIALALGRLLLASVAEGQARAAAANPPTCIRAGTCPAAA